ncbi:MAG: flagellar biosynthesis protein FlhB [Helicobacteraceae bacterium]|jgi:flagellar biosynthetic protein FlhB|nr:flagellar biosynthesis protein FlhB [Helicobacteraceae bacterium]
MAEESSSEKTEEATPKRLEDAQKEGNVPKSVDAAGFVSLLSALLCFVVFFGFIFEKMADFFRFCVSYDTTALKQSTIAAIAISAIAEMLKSVLPIALVVSLAGSIGYVLQFGLIFTAKPLQPNLNKLNPIKGFANLFSLQRLLDGLKITLKVAVAMIVAGWLLWNDIRQLPTVLLMNLGDQIVWMLEKGLKVALVLLIVFFCFAVVDFAIVRYFHFKRLRMSKQELRDEYKHLEGNPEIKARIRRIQMEMSRRRMMADIPRADVVVTNPTHFAVALKYEPKKNDKNPAPIVLAKGADELAVRIKAIAREHDIPIVERPELARELYRLVDIGQKIPAALFQAAAELFAYVARTTGKRFV